MVAVWIDHSDVIAAWDFAVICVLLIKSLMAETGCHTCSAVAISLIAGTEMAT